MLVEAVFSMLIGNPMLFFLHDSLAADNPQVKHEWVHVRGMGVDSASRLLAWLQTCRQQPPLAGGGMLGEGLPLLNPGSFLMHHNYRNTCVKYLSANLWGAL